MNATVAGVRFEDANGCPLSAMIASASTPHGGINDAAPIPPAYVFFNALRAFMRSPNREAPETVTASPARETLI